MKMCNQKDKSFVEGRKEYVLNVQGIKLSACTCVFKELTVVAIENEDALLVVYLFDK